MNNSSLFTEASLVDSSIYKAINGNAELMKMIASAIKNSIEITSNYIEEQVIQIKRTKISPLSEDVLKAYDEGHIVLLYAKNQRVPQALPFFATKTNGTIKVFIFVNNFGTISKSSLNSEEKYLNISMKDLYVLMEGAYTAYKYAIYPVKMVKTLGLMKVSCKIYVSMIMRILNKEYAIGMDKELYTKVAFTLGLFFLKRVWMSTNDDINFSYAVDAAKVGTEAIISAPLTYVQEDFNQKNVQNADDLINFMKTFTPRLSELNFRYFLQMYINLFKAPAMFSLECLPYFLFTIEASMIGSFIVNQPIISDVTKNVRGMNMFYPELVKALL